jgi:hypothetical protein
MKSFSKNKKWIFCDVIIQQRMINYNHHSVDCNQQKPSLFIKFKSLFWIVVALFRVFYYFMLQFFIVKDKTITVNSKAIFLKSKNGYDIDNLFKVYNYKNSELVIIDAFKIKDYMSVIRIDFMTLMRSFMRSFINYYSIIGYGFPRDIESAVARHGCRNIAQYSYILSFFQTIEKKICVYSGGALFASNAAIEANLKTTYLLHGLMERVHSVVFPNFYKVYVYSKDEKMYIKSLGIKSNINVYPSIKIKSKRKCILIFMRDCDKNMNMIKILDMVNFFKLNNYLVLIKLHPQYRGKMINEDNIPGVKVISKDTGDASSLINSFHPSFVVAWQSTALCESLQAEIIPIRMSHKITGLVMPYPLKERTLSWSNEKSIVRKSIVSSDFYDKTVHMLINR